MNSYEGMAHRLVNAEIQFIEDVREQFGKTQDEAEKIFKVFLAKKVIKLCPHSGRAILSHGIFWEQAVMDTALTL